MTRDETIKQLSILKAAYPNFYKDMSRDTANGTINIWASQFAKYPANVVMIAVNKLISLNTFPPSINEVKEKIRGLYWEAWEMKRQHEQALDPNCIIGTLLDEKTLATVNDILRVCEPMRTQQQLEPSLTELLNGFSGYLSGGCDSTKQIEGK
ncbi:MAG: hypothetical protein J6Q67_06270 [Clostridia bacterium]|nr:hypothetical protein [Clostridia bacterium]